MSTSPDALASLAAEASLSRRQVLSLLGSGGAAAVLAACGRVEDGAAGAEEGDAAATMRPWVKDSAPFIQHPTNLETRLERIEGLLTPNDQFFVRNHTPTPRIDAATYRLRIEGDGIERPVELAYEDVLRLPSRSVVAYLECAGNWRRFFGEVMGTPASGSQWGTGGVGCAEWTGTPLSSVLDLAGLRRTAVDVNLLGLDEGEFNRPMSVGKALDDDTILVYAMNGEPLPPDHGFPLRAVVPGWVGSNSVKWLGRIVVSNEKVWVKNNTTSYVMMGPDWPADRFAPAEGGPINEQSIKSALALPWPARLEAGERTVRGFAYSPGARVAEVEWSLDGGGTWRPARLADPILQHAWARFEIFWNAPAGSHTVTVRAIDELGNTQPPNVPFNEKGYLYNAPLPHPVRVG